MADDAPDHLALLLQSRDGVGLRQARRMILSVWTEHGNSDMVWNEALTEGILELTATAPFHSMALRSITNASGDFSLTPYPAESSPGGPLYFAHLVADGDYSSEVLFWNSDTQAITARLEFFSPAGAAVAVGAQPASSDFTIAPAQLVRVRLPRSATPFYGYARLTRTGGPSLPSTSAVITRWANDRPIAGGANQGSVRFFDSAGRARAVSVR